MSPATGRHCFYLCPLYNFINKYKTFLHFFFSFFFFKFSTIIIRQGIFRDSLPRVVWPPLLFPCSRLNYRVSHGTLFRPIDNCSFYPGLYFNRPRNFVFFFLSLTLKTAHCNYRACNARHMSVHRETLVCRESDKCLLPCSVTWPYLA